jgi:hypothetical protein
MLTVAHSTFCLIDLGDASVRGLSVRGVPFNVVEFFMRLNIVGVGRFTISIYGEAKRGLKANKVSAEAVFLKKEITIVNDYISGLKTISSAYNDEHLLTFINDFQASGLYIEAFNKSVEFARLRNVPENEVLTKKSDIDTYFQGDSKL